MKVLKVSIVMLFLFWIVSIFLGYNLYLLQKEKLKQLQSKLNFYAQRLSSYSEEVVNLKNNLRKLNSKIVAEMKELERKIAANSLKNSEIFSLVGKMRRDIHEWQKDYHHVLVEIKQCLEKWQKEITSEVSQQEVSQEKKDVSQKKVELGEISVKK